MHTVHLYTGCMLKRHRVTISVGLISWSAKYYDFNHLEHQCPYVYIPKHLHTKTWYDILSIFDVISWHCGGWKRECRKVYGFMSHHKTMQGLLTNTVQYIRSSKEAQKRPYTTWPVLSLFFNVVIHEFTESQPHKQTQMDLNHQGQGSRINCCMASPAGFDPDGMDRIHFEPQWKQLSPKQRNWMVWSANSPQREDWTPRWP